MLATARRPVLILGSDVWLGRAEAAARSCAEELRLPVITNGQARGVLPNRHELLISRARGIALAEADLVIVAGTPLDFRLKYGRFGPRTPRPPSSTSPTPPAGWPATARWRPGLPGT